MKRLELYDDTTSTDDVIRVEKSRLIGMSNNAIHDEYGGILVSRNTNKPFVYCAIRLNRNYDWVFGEDENGDTLAIPLAEKRHGGR